MTAKLNFSLLAICGFGFALSAFAQIDSSRFASDLRAKYGPPLARETFTARPGMQLRREWPRMQNRTPPVGPGREPGVKTGQAVDDFLLELAPLTMRGKELQKFYQAMGALSMSSVEYENVIISESLQGSRRTGITVLFRNEACQDQ